MVAPYPRIAKLRIVLHRVERLASLSVKDSEVFGRFKRVTVATIVADSLVGRLEVRVADENRVFRLEELHLVWLNPHARVREDASRSVHRSRCGADDHLGLAVAVEIGDDERLVVRPGIEVEPHVDLPQARAVHLQAVEPRTTRKTTYVVTRSV